jgi:hypothetical protein
MRLAGSVRGARDLSNAGQVTVDSSTSVASGCDGFMP